MKFILLLVATFPSFLFGQDLTDELTGQTDKMRAKLKKTREVEFGGGDVWGTVFYYSNSDSSELRIIEKYNAGDYGNGEVEYFIVDGNLILQKEYILDWLVKGNQDGLNYKFRETIFYFDDDSTGFKTTKYVLTRTLSINEHDRKTLEKASISASSLTPIDYSKQMEELIQVTKRELLKD